MRVVDRLGELNRPCAFVPTMGALHAGHQSLIQIARELCDEVIVSVFVNPLQFENKDDLAKYPKTPERDEELAKEAGATILWRPRYEDIYPEGYKRLSAGMVGEIYEGASRPGHFDGVVTVVNRLFEMVRPRYAIFGEKDFQQLFLIRKLAEESFPEIEIISAPTIREISGLALSSRNVRLGTQGRIAADAISQALRSAQDVDTLVAIQERLSTLADSPNFTLDYAEVIDEENFQPATESTIHKRAIVAGWIDGVRLIDNMAIKPALVRS